MRRPSSPTTTVSVLRSEITQQQAASGTPVDQRVELQTLKSGSPATLAQGHSKSIPILVLFAVLSASIALAFILNNHSDDPVRSTRRRLDEGLGPDGGWRSPAPAIGRVARARARFASDRRRKDAIDWSSQGRIGYRACQ